jgi:hypothetical protein
MDIPELGFSIDLGEIVLTECETVNQFTGSKTEPPQFTRGYGLVFGQTERKAISMALVDRALRWEELGEDNVGAPAQDGIRALSFRRAGDGVPRTHQAAPLRGFPVRAGADPASQGRGRPGGRGMSLVAAAESPSPSPAHRVSARRTAPLRCPR